MILSCLFQDDISEKQTKVLTVDAWKDLIINSDCYSFSVAAGKAERTDQFDLILQSVFFDCLFKHCD